MGKANPFYSLRKFIYSEMNISHTKNLLEVALIIEYKLRNEVMHFVAIFEGLYLKIGGRCAIYGSYNVLLSKNYLMCEPRAT